METVNATQPIGFSRETQQSPAATPRLPRFSVEICSMNEICVSYFKTCFFDVGFLT